MAKDRRKQVKVNDAVMRDLGQFATNRVQQALLDAVTLLDTQAEAYALAASVVGGIVCWLAQLHPSNQPHAAKIAVVMKDLAEIMEMHSNHEGRQQ